MLILPAIDLKEGRCVRLRQGEKNAVTVYSDQPVETAQRWKDEGAELLHVVNLDGAFDDADTQNLTVVEHIVSRVSLRVQFGGGIRSIRQVERLVDLGVCRIVLGTMAVEQPEILAELVERFPAQLVVGIDARDGTVATHGWVKAAPVSATELAGQMARIGVRRIVYTDISRDGMLSGPNLEMTQRIAVESGLKVTASGGISSLDDIHRLKDLHPDQVDSCIVGKALYENRFSLAAAVLAGKRET